MIEKNERKSVQQCSAGGTLEGSTLRDDGDTSAHTLDDFRSGTPGHATVVDLPRHKRTSQRDQAYRYFTMGRGRWRIPRQVGPFRLECILGKGSMGIVSEAVDQETGRAAALKLVPIDSEVTVRALEVEADGLARLHHPNIPRIIARGRQGDFAWIATELVRGRTLEQIIKSRFTGHNEPLYVDLTDDDSVGKQPAMLPPTRGRHEKQRMLRSWMRWFRDLALALNAMHEAGLIHRDIKPSNIMISDDGIPYLIDFGLSLDEATAHVPPGTLAGTVPYMSPEQTLGGLVGLTQRSDLYSLAVTFHELLSLQRVAAGEGRTELLQEIAFDPVLPPSRVTWRVPATLDPIFQKSLAKHPRDRYASGLELAEDLERWLACRPLLHARENVGVRARRVLRHHPLVCVTCALVVLLLCGTAALHEVGYRTDLARTLAQVRADLDGGRERAALELVRARAGDLGSDERFEGYYREAVAKTSPRLIMDMIRAQSVAVGDLADHARFLRLAREAKRDLVYRPDAQLVFIVAFGHMLSGDWEAVEATLQEYEDLTCRDRLLLELRAMILLSVPRSATFASERWEAILRDLAALPPATVGSCATCMRALRLLWQVDRAHRRPDLGLEAPLEVLEKARSAMQFVLGEQPEHRLALTLLGRIDLETGRYRSAMQCFERLQRGEDQPAERAGPLFYSALGAIMASQVAGADSGVLREHARARAREAFAMAPCLRTLLVERAWQAWLQDGDWRPAYEALRIALPAPVGEELPVGVLQVALNVTSLALAGEEFPVAAEVGGLLAAAWKPGLPQTESSLHDRILKNRLWALCHRFHAEAGGDTPVEQLVEEADRILDLEKRELTRRGSLPFEARCAAARVVFRMVEAAPDGEARSVWIARARAEIDPLCYRSVVRDARSAARNPKMQEVLEKLVEENAKMVEELDAIAPSSAGG